MATLMAYDGTRRAYFVQDDGLIHYGKGVWIPLCRGFMYSGTTLPAFDQPITCLQCLSLSAGGVGLNAGFFGFTE